MTNIAIRDEAAAKTWNSDIQTLNEETANLIKQVGETLKQVKEDADSSVVDDIFKWGSEMVESANGILQGMNQLVSSVAKALSLVNEVLDTGKNLVKGIVNAITNI